MLITQQDQNSARYILSIIQEEEQQSDEIKQLAKGQRALPAPVVEEGAVVDPSAASAEQSFNREQVQEQEQEQEQEQVLRMCSGTALI